MTLEELFEIIDSRTETDQSASWTAKLLAKGPEKCAEKFGEEAIEAIIEAIKDDKTKGKVLVGGGSGFVGTEVCSLLRRKGYDVITVSRTKFDSRVVTWDDIRFRGLPDNTIAVVNLAGR